MPDAPADRKGGSDADGAVTIRRTANRQMYHSGSGRYVTLEDLAKMATAGVEFIVYDATSRADITTNILRDIILERASRDSYVFSDAFMRRLITLYTTPECYFFPGFIELSLSSYRNQREQLRTYSGSATAAVTKFLENLAQRNAALLDFATKISMPFLRE